MTRILLTAVAIAWLSAAAPAVAADYSDAAGDNGAAADIGAVRVQLGTDGYVHVRPEIAAQPALFTPGSGLIAFDTDRSLATGGGGGLQGADVLVVVTFEDLSGTVLRWNGSDYEQPDLASGDVRYLVGSSSFELLIRPKVLGDVASFSFSVFASTGGPETDAVDRAPDAGMWLFDAAPARTVKTLDVTWAPAAPRAGSVFRPAAVTLDLSDGTAVRPTSYRCTATLGGKALRGRGAGGCTYAIPRNARGKRLSITVVASYGGRSIPFEPYAFRVR